VLSALAPDPFGFDAHVPAMAAVALLASAYAWAVTHQARRLGPGALPTRRQRWWLAGALGGLLVALGWPVADLAAHWSLTALLVQRLLLMLVVAPMLLMALPVTLVATLTRPAPVDRAVEVLTRPAPAVVLVTLVAVGTLFTPAVAAEASSPVARGIFDVLLLGAGMVLWAPVMGHLPGVHHPAALALAVYLFVQSIVPGFPAVIFVFARHPLYPAFADAHRAIGLSALDDQQLAGVLAKVATLPVLWSVAWVALTRADQARGAGGDEDTRPLTWAEVERQLERAERAERAEAAQAAGSTRRASRHRRPGHAPRPGRPGNRQT
jgi:putative membrane protein